MLRAPLWLVSERLGKWYMPSLELSAVNLDKQRVGMRGGRNDVERELHLAGTGAAEADFGEAAGSVAVAATVLSDMSITV